MARGDSRAPDVISEDQGEKVKDYAADVLKVALASDTFAACAAFTNFSQFTEVAGTGYTAGGATSNSTWVRSGGVTDLGMANVGWAQNAAGPTNIRVAVVYDSTVLGSDDVITEDGWLFHLFSISATSSIIRRSSAVSASSSQAS